MKRRGNAIVSVLLSTALTFSPLLSPAALANDREVSVDNHTAISTSKQIVNSVQIGNVYAPVAGMTLDDEATVTTAEHATWQIPVLWVSDDLQVVSGEVLEDCSYVPVLAFYVPQEYALEGDTFAVTLSDELSELFGTDEIVSVYDSRTGITYILPASLVGLFARADNVVQDSTETNELEAFVGAEQGQSQETTPTLVDIYCSQTAKDALSNEDLEWLIDLILHRLEPQAVNLLLSKFPSFGEAAARGEISTQIGLYIYFEKGDDDGKYEHGTAPDTVAYALSATSEIDGSPKFCHMLGLDTLALVRKNNAGEPIRDPSTGKFTLLREGSSLTSLQNTIVHELFHAIMADYNRTGMTGTNDLEDIRVDATGNYAHPDRFSRMALIEYPRWFLEGSATAVENVYQYHYDSFELLRRENYGLGKPNRLYDANTLFNNYAYGMKDKNTFAYFDLEYHNTYTDDAGNNINTNYSRYTSGYLATLYLSDLAARHINDGESAIRVGDDGTTTIDATRLRMGLDSLMRWMHEGQTMDELVNSLSPTDDNNQPIYKNTDDLTKKFIKGEKNGEGEYVGDEESLAFTVAYLNNLRKIEEELPKEDDPNGSILQDFDVNYQSMLDPNQEATAPVLAIAESNGLVESSVASDQAAIGGGKSAIEPGPTAAADAQGEGSPQGTPTS